MQIDPNEIWTTYGQIFIASALNVVAATAILVIGLWVSAWAGDTMRTMSRKHPRIDDTLAAFFSWIVRYGLMAFVIVAVLNRFGVATTSIVAVIGAGALAIGLALQGTLSNVAAGVMLMLFRPYRLGDHVELAGQNGIVDDIHLFTTELRTLQNIKIVLPNSICWGAPMINYTGYPSRRIDLDFAVAYDTDIEVAISVLNEAMKSDKRVMAEPAPSVVVSQLGDFAIVLAARAWAPARDFIPVRFALLKAGKEALDANRIVIPFPTNTNYEVRLDEAPRLSSDENGAKV
jgi:small conductance mechanosensitive channel